TFFNFHPDMVRSAIPDAWSYASPAALLEVRATAAAAVLRRLVTDVDDAAKKVEPLLRQPIDAADAPGRSLFAANRDVAVPSDPVAALWQATTTLREHRGDGHVSVLTSEGLDGCEAHVLFAMVHDVPRDVYQRSRGWSDDDWSAALSELFGKGWLAADGTITSTGREVHGEIEARTDASAAGPWRTLGTAGTARLAALLAPLAERIVGRVVPYPNPIGVPRAG
ncbi:MAG: hypothetical protein QOF97_2821, partial [Acidimicrobiaceae bacterium]